MVQAVKTSFESALFGYNNEQAKYKTVDTSGSYEKSIQAIFDAQKQVRPGDAKAVVNSAYSDSRDNKPLEDIFN